MMKLRLKGMIRCALCVLVFAVTVLCAAAPCLAAGTRTTLRVAFYPLEGFFAYDKAGNETGYGVDLLEKLEDYANVEFEYVYADSWEVTKDMLLSGEADIRMPGTLPSKPSTTLGYTEQNVLDTFHVIMTLRTNGNLYYMDTARFPSIKVALTEYAYTNSDAIDYVLGLGVKDENLIRYEDYDACLAALKTGEVDALLSNIMDLTEELKIIARFNSTSNYISMTIGNPWLAVLDNALYELKMDDPTFRPELYEKWFPERTAVPLTRGEAEYIANCGPITVGMIRDRYSFSVYHEDTGEITGMNKDIVAWIADYTGLDFRLKPLNEGEKTVDALSSGHVDMVAGVMRTNAFERNPDIILSDSFNRTTVSVVKSKSYSYAVDEPQTVAVTQAFKGMQDYILANYPNYEFVYFATNEDCLDAVLAGDADIMLQNVYVMDYLLQKPKYADLQLLSASFFEEENCFMLPRDANPALVTILNKAIKAMPKETLADIVLANTTAEPYEYTLEDTYYKFKTPILVIAALIFACAALLITVIATRQKSLRRAKLANAQLAEAYEQARIASRAKSDFLAQMSHDIRTPMNAIIGIATLARDHAEGNAAINEDLDKIDLSSRVLLSLINDVLDMSAIESGKLKLARAPFDFKQVIASVTTVYYAQCRAKGIRFESRLLSPIDEMLIGDQLRLNQILMNLLSNAVKFTDAGCVTLTVEQEKAEQKQIFVKLTVSDTGCGMSEELKTRLFKPFEQESAETAKEHGGSGLGLSIVHSLVTLMGGVIKVESEKNSGTTFTVELPFERENGSARHQGAGIGDIRVLAVDDELDTRNYTTAVLNRMQVRHSCVDSGDAALVALRAARDAGDPFNVCILDWRMPNMDGVELTRRIRAEYDKSTTIIIASAYDHSEIESTAEGVDLFVTKPLFQSTLFDLFMSLTHGKLRQPEKAVAVGVFAGRRVLLAEDNEMNRIVATGFLRKLKVECDCAVNGEEALTMFEASEPGYYDAVLMDMQMPIMDGVESTKAIRASAHPYAKSIPIIAMTANAFSEDIAACLVCGMNDHVAKPVDMLLLSAALQRAFEEGKDNDGAEKGN